MKCRAVDAEGPLARLKNLLFNKDTLRTVAQWITVSYKFECRIIISIIIIIRSFFFSGILVGGSVNGNSFHYFHGVVHQVLCCSHSIE